MGANYNTKKETVFISYSHHDEEYVLPLRSQIESLFRPPQVEVWNDRDIDVGEDFFQEIKEAMQRATAAICMISSYYLSSPFVMNEEIPVLLERQAQEGLLLIPVLVRDCVWQDWPWLTRLQMIPRDGKSVRVDFKDKEELVFREVAEQIRRKLKDPEYSLETLETSFTPLPKDHVYIDRLPQTGTDIFGRNRQLADLDEAWDSPETNVVTIIAGGGVGKSALVNKWVGSMRGGNFRRAKRVYAWSFYSQGTGQRVTAADVFIDHALGWFGDLRTAASKRSPWDKGWRLADAIRKVPTLLILDGLEPLQQAYGPQAGNVIDPALSVLLKQLARENPGLCVVSSRVPLAGIGGHDNRFQVFCLDQISEDSGRALLRYSDIRGTNEDLKQATRNFGNHALAIKLLAAYLKLKPGRHISAASDIPDINLEEKEGRHPRRVMEAFVIHFGQSRETNLLNFMGLFDRPVTMEVLEYLSKHSSIPGVTDHIHNLSQRDLKSVITTLRQFDLLLPPSHHAPEELDAHPFVREHFAARLCTKNQKSWERAHGALFEYYSSQSANVEPTSTEKMTALLLGVSHGCFARRFKEVLEEIFKPKILGQTESYSRNVVSRHGEKLAAISGFFDSLWADPVGDLSREDKGLVLHHASVCLRALGRLSEVIEPARAALRIRVALGLWKQAVRSSGTLAQAQLALGDVGGALVEFEMCRDYADKSEHLGSRIASRAVLANAMNQSGNLIGAMGIMTEAEDLQKHHEPDIPFLHSLRGYYQHDILLAYGRNEEVVELASRALELAEKKGWNLARGLGELALGKAHLADSLSGLTTDLRDASRLLEDAVRHIQEDGALDQLPRGLLARASVRRVTGKFRECRADLEEVHEIAERDGMRLFLADYYLECVRLSIAKTESKMETSGLSGTTRNSVAVDDVEDIRNAINWTNTAREVIRGSGYGRRAPEVDLLQAKIASLLGEKTESREALVRAKEGFSAIGIREWEFCVSKLEIELDSN